MLPLLTHQLTRRRRPIPDRRDIRRQFEPPLSLLPSPLPRARARSPEPDGRRPTAATTDDRRPRDPERARDRTVHVTGGGGGCGAAEVAPDPLLS